MFCIFFLFQGSPSPRVNGDHNSRDGDRDSVGMNGDRKATSSADLKTERPPSRSGSSSSRSTPSLKTKDVSRVKIIFDEREF